MGAAVSLNSVDVVNNSIIDVIVQSSNNCTASVAQQQNVQFSGFSIFSSAKQNLTISLSCIQNVQVDNDLASQMANQIQQQASSQAIALLPGFSGSANTQRLSNYLTTKITTSTIQNCVANVAQSQNVSFSGVQVGSAAEQTLNTFMNCMQKALNQNNVAQGIVNDVTQKAESKVVNPLDFLGQWWVIILVVLVIGAIIFAMIMFGGGGGGGVGPEININVPQVVPYEEENIVPYETQEEYDVPIAPENPSPQLPHRE